MPVATAGFGLMTPLLLGGDGRGGFRAQGRGWMQRTRPAKGAGASGRSGRAAADTGSTHHGLAGANRAAVDRLAWYGRRAASGHPGPGRLLLNLAGSRTGLLLLQSRHHIWTRGYYRTRRRLPGEIGARLRTQRRPRSGRGQRRRSFAGRGRLRNADDWRRCKRDGRRRHGDSGSGRRQRLPRSRQNLSRPRRGNGARRNRTGA
jgi:hypothetical protein